MKILLYAKTYYQIVFSLQLKNTILKNDDVYLIISDNSINAEKISVEIDKLKVFSKAYSVKIKDLISDRSLKMKLRDCFDFSFRDKNQYSFLIDDIQNKYFDQIICFNYQKDIIGLYNILYPYNKNLFVSFFEEGILSYNYPKSSKYTVVISEKIRHLFRKKNAQDVFHTFYCFYPRIYMGALDTVTVPLVSKKCQTAIQLKKVFKPDLSVYTKKYIFFTSVYDFEGGKSIGEYDLVCKIAALVGKDNLLVKIHPRDTRTIYMDNGFCVDKNSAIPWEAIQLSGDFSDKIFMTVNSGSVFSGSTMSDAPVRTYYMYKLCDIEGNQSCQKNVKDIERILNHESMKSILREVKIAERLEDIL